MVAKRSSLVRAHTPDLLLLDIWMPVLNGLEVLEQIGKSPEAIGVRVVVLSHVNDADTRLEGFALGVDDYWTKDMTLEELCAGIQQLVSMGGNPPESLADLTLSGCVLSAREESNSTDPPWDKTIKSDSTFSTAG